MSFVVRDAVRGDRPALLDLWVAAWIATMPRIDFEQRRGWLSNRLDALEGGGGALLVACAGDRPIGFITVDPQGEVDQLVVAIERQGRGVASALVAAADARSGCGLRLTVNADNLRAVAFYQAQGFEVSGGGTNPNSGLPVLLMARPADLGPSSSARRAMQFEDETTQSTKGGLGCERGLH